MNKNDGCVARACAAALFSMVCAAATAAAPQPRNVPELMRTAAGKPVATPAEWEKTRRPEILDFFERNVFGKRPAALSDRSRVSFRTVSSEDVFDDNAVRKIVVVRFDGPEGAFEFPLTAYIPRTTAPAPVFVNILLSPHSGTVVSPDGARHNPSRWPVKDILARGYATVSYMVTDVAADEKGKGFSQGIFKAVEKESARNDESWGTLSAWAWAASKVVDWIETQSELDAKRIAIVGHSRGGKTALWAAATDRRIAMPCSNESGCTGAKLNHIDLPRSESIKAITYNFPYWFCNNYLKFAGKDKEAPFDQHWLVALAAPRPACVGSGSKDYWTGPLGEWWSAKLASPAWALYGKKGLVADAFPSPGGVQQDGCVSYHLRSGGHDLAPYDWQRYMDFADKQVR